MKSQHHQPNPPSRTSAISGGRLRPLVRVGVILVAAATLAACGNNDTDTPVEATDGPPVDDAALGAEILETVDPPAIVDAERLDLIPAPDETIEVPPAADIAAAPVEAVPMIAEDVAPIPPTNEILVDDGGAVAPVDEPTAGPRLTDEDIALDAEMEALIAAGDAGAGQSYIQRCTSCHSFRPEGPGVGGPFVGPAMFGIFGGIIGGAEDFEYSPAFETLREAELEWNDARLNAFLTDPRGMVPGTTMTIRGISDAEDRANIIAYIRTLVPDEAPPGVVGDAELLQRIADADIADGELLAARCAVCHAFTEDAETLVGPNLFGIIGTRVGAADGFAYSAAMTALGTEDALWTYDRIDAFLTNPAIAVPGTRMGFGGIDDEDNRAAVIAFLRSISPDAPDPLGVSLLGIGEAVPGLTPLAFTSNQVSFGAQFYSTLGCTECHGRDLQGFAAASPPRVAPALVGEAFTRRWFGGTVYDFYDFVYQHAGSLAEIQDGQIPMLVAYILTQSGFEAVGTSLLPRDRQTLQAMGFYQ